MGHTHYFRQLRNHSTEEWTQVREDVGAILKHVQHVAGVALAVEYDCPGKGPLIGETKIRFNGLGDDGHETFEVYKVVPAKQPGSHGTRGSDFCKTENKPYDLAVTAVLCYLSSVSGTFSVTSDGDGSEWLPGLQAARRALPRWANVLDIPIDILRSDRWCGPWVHHFTKAFRFEFCVDGHAYVFKVDDEAVAYRFESHAEAAGYSRRHGSVFAATGRFDAKRISTLKRQQSRLLGHLVRNAEFAGRNHRPPAFMRPAEMPAVEKDMSTFSDLVNMGA